MRERRLFLIIFDIAFSRPYHIERAREAAQSLIAEAKPGDYFAIATFAQNRGVQILVPFTTDTAAVRVAIRGAAVANDDPLRLVVPPAVRTEMTAAIPAEEAADYPNQASEKPAGAYNTGLYPGETQVGETRAETVDRHRVLTLEALRPIIEAQLSSLNEIATRLAALEGQKHMVLISEGFDASALDDPRRKTGAARDLTAPYITRLLEDMAKPFRASGVFLHTLEVSGLSLFKTQHGQAGVGGGGQIMGGPRARNKRQETLNLLASETGGEYVHDRNDLRGGLAYIRDTYSRGYLLGFRPIGARSGYNSIDVKVKGQRGIKVRHRVGFTGSSPAANPTDALHLADIILNDMPQTGVPARLLMSEGRLQARIPMDQVAAVLGKPGRAELMVYVFDANGAALDFRRQVLDVPAGATGDYPVNLVLGLPPGAYTIKALLRTGDSVGFSRVKLNVTAPAD